MQPPPKPQVSGRAARNSWDLRQWIASSLSLVMVAITAGCGAPKAPPATPLTPAVKQPLEEALQLPYLTLFDEAPTLEFSDTQIKKMRQYEEK